MEKEKIIRKIGFAIMIFGAIFMVASYILTENINYVMGGLVVVSIGSLLNKFGTKKD